MVSAALGTVLGLEKLLSTGKKESIAKKKEYLFIINCFISSSNQILSLYLYQTQ